MTDKAQDTNLNHAGPKAGQEGIDLHYFKFRVRQLEQTLTWQRAVLVHHSVSLAHMRKRLENIEHRLRSIAA